MIRRVASSLCLLFVLATVPASAYDIGSHEQLTREAVALIGRCARHDPRLWDPSIYLNTLIDLNVGQDDVLRKARLWHFPFVARGTCSNPCSEECYSRKWCPYGLWFICDMPVFRSFDPWVNHLIRRASFAREPAEVYRAAGALLHYVQDLAVPAHALPVFHPVPICHGDELDGYGVTVTHCNLQLEQPGDVCERLDDAKDLTSLLLAVRATTEQSVAKSFPLRSPQGEKRSWSAFWRSSSDPEAPEFKQYGCKAFGQSRVECANEAFEVDPKTYAQFANTRASEAILASAQLIVYLQKQVAADAVPGGEDVEAAVDRWLPSLDRLKRIARDHPEACRPLRKP